MEKIKLKDFLTFKAPSCLTLSPNGEVVAYLVNEIKDNKYVKSLYIYRNGKTTKLFEDEKVSRFEFKDDNTISFTSLRGKKDEARVEKGEMFTSFYEIKLDGGEAYKTYELPISVNKVTKIDERLSLISAGIDVRFPDLYKLKNKEKSKALEEIKKSKDYKELTESPYVFNGVGFIQGSRSNLFLYDNKTKILNRLLEPYFDVDGYVIMDRLIYIVGSHFETTRPLKSSIYTYNLDNNEFKEIVPPTKMIMTIQKVGDDILLFAEMDNAPHHGLNVNDHIYRLDRTNNKLILINAADESLGHGILSDVEYGVSRFFKADDKYLYFPVNDIYDTHLKRADREGNIEMVISRSGALSDYDVINGKVVYSGLYDNQLLEVYNQNGKRISSLNTKYCRSHSIQKPEYIKTTYQGEEIDGWVLYPVDYDSSKKYPGILDIHGGPKCAYGEVYFHEMQVWANKGYFVFFSNPHGSDGKGNDFADLAGRWGQIDYEHIMAFVDNVLEHYPNIDKERLGCTGGSYGGYMSNWILGHTDRFKAIATQRSIMNWVSMYGIGDITPNMCDWVCDTNPYSEEGYRQMWEHSPLKYIDNAKTPTLIIHSENDYRCPVSEGYQLFTALTYKGIPCKMVMFHGENHELSRGGKPSNRVKRLEEITGWFDKYLTK